MKKIMKAREWVIMAALLIPGAAVAQNASGNSGTRVNCMRQAGIPLSLAKQLRSINKGVKSAIQQVCGSSDSMREKRQQIRQIRQTAKQQRKSLLSGQQSQALQQCRRANAPQRSHGDPCQAFQSDGQ